MNGPTGKIMTPGIIDPTQSGGVSSQSNRQSLNMNPYQNQHKSMPNSMV